MSRISGLQVQAECACGAYSVARRAITGCGGRCQDPSGRSCNALRCPGCGHLHSWSGSFKPPRPGARIFDADGRQVPIGDVYPYAELREYLRRNRQVCSAVGARSLIDTALDRLACQRRPPQWLGELLERARLRVEPLTADLVAWRDQLRPAVDHWHALRAAEPPLAPRQPRREAAP